VTDSVLPFTPRRPKLDEAADMQVINQWFERAHRVTSMAQAGDLALDFLRSYEHGLDTLPHVVALAAVAAATVIANSAEGKALGVDKSVQAHNLATWVFIEEFGGFDDGPRRMLQYRQMLYPTNQKRFEKTIDRSTRDWLIAQAKETLESGRDLHPAVQQHLGPIALGIMPWGYTVEEE
jgi:hypothetical protein